MKIKYSIIIALCLTIFLTGKLFSQELKALRIGDRVPDVYLREMLNYKTTSAYLNDLRTKPLIIDFWFIGCSSCVDLMPHLDSLQKEYNGKLQILLSTFESKIKVENFFNKSRFVSGLKFTQVVNDSVLRKLFPTRINPHQVWIGKDGKIKAITDGKSATRKNIEKFIKGEYFEFVPKINEELDSYVSMVVDPAIGYNYDKNKDKIINYSYLSEYREGFSGITGQSIIDSVKHILRFKAINAHVLHIYDNAYNGGTYNTIASTMGQTHLKSRFVREDSGKTIPLIPDYKNFDQYYCYDLICRFDTTRSGIEKAISKSTINDLDRAFNLKSHTEKRMIKFWVLKEYGNSRIYQKPVGQGSGFYANIMELFIGKKLIIENITSLSFIVNLNRYSDVPFMSEVPYTGRMSFELTWTPNDIVAMSKELRKYGLDITLEERERDVVVIKDN